MFQHTLLLAYRGFLRFKSTFLINLVGLSTGLACTLLIYLWVSDELKVDKIYDQDSQLFQIMENRERADGLLTSPTTSGPLATALAQDMPEVVYAATASRPQQATLSVGEKNIRAKGKYVSKDYFRIFSHSFLQGDRESVLADPNSVIISETLARKLFTDINQIIGKTIELDHDKVYQISGVYKDIPATATIQFEYALSYEKFIQENDWAYSWNNTAPYTYLLLQPGTDINQFNQKIADFVKVKTANETTHRTLFAKRFSENYLYGEYENGVQVGGRIEYVKLFSIIALFILVIACINFMNLATAKASRRLKEVGVRKAIGANRASLVFQYLGESLVMAFLAMVVSLVLVKLLLPQFNQVTGKSLNLSFNLYTLLLVGAVTGLTGLIAGSYPALYLSGFNPITILKGKLPTSFGEIWVRKGLVVFQFALSIILMVGVVVVYQQIEFVQNQHLGYEKDNLIYLRKEGKLQDKSTLAAFLAEVKNVPGIVQASSIAHSLTGHNSGTSGIQWPGKAPDDKTEFENVAVNYDMIETLGIKMAAGRTFSKEYGADSTKIILNEAAVRFMNLTDPVGKVVTLWGNDTEIIGVAKDFHFESLHEKVKPLFFRLNPDHTKSIVARIQAGSEKETIQQLQKLNTAYNPGFSFEFKFLDEDYQKQYESEKRVSRLAQYFAGLAILISCLGLFGLAAFTAERRRKEIGVRKVLGASSTSIVYMLSSDFTKMVLVAIFISLPASYLLVEKWLHNFEYRIELEWWYFVGAGLIALVIAWLTVGTQAIRAAAVNPAHILKEE